MAVNDKVSQSQYNNIRNKLVPVIGAGSGTSGWGQTIVSTSVAEGNTVTINEWTNLGYDITNAYKHISGANPSIASVAEGNTIRYSTTFSPASSAVPVTQYDQWADTIVASKYTLATGSAITTNKGTKTWSGTWNGTLAATVTVTFTSATAARYFFNSGGEIRFVSSRSGGNVTTQNTSWTSILSSAGTRSFGAVLPDVGTSPANGTNYYRCTANYQRWYTNTGSTPYSLNSYNISARTPGVSDNSTGTARTIEFYVEWKDDHVGIAGGFDQVDGTISLSVTTLEASQVLVPLSAGSFTVESPTVTVGNIA